MNSEEVKGTIQLDNLNLYCLIYKIKDNNNIEILSTSTAPSEGIS